MTRPIVDEMDRTTKVRQASARVLGRLLLYGALAVSIAITAAGACAGGSAGSRPGPANAAERALLR